MRDDHPAVPRPNRFSAKCCHCGKWVAAGQGATEKVMGTARQWRTYHIACDQKAHPDQYETVSRPRKGAAVVDPVA